VEGEVPRAGSLSAVGGISPPSPPTSEVGGRRYSLRKRMSHFAIAATHELGQRCILGFVTNRKEHR
jgi:hypothetical protein